MSFASYLSNYDTKTVNLYMIKKSLISLSDIVSLFSLTKGLSLVSDILVCRESYYHISVNNIVFINLDIGFAIEFLYVSRTVLKIRYLTPKLTATRSSEESRPLSHTCCTIYLDITFIAIANSDH